MSDINIGTSGVNYTDYKTSVPTQTGKDASVGETEKNLQETGVSYDRSTTQDTKKEPYKINKMSEEERAQLVEKLKQDQVERQNQMVDIVRKMFTGQAGTFNLAELFTPENLKDVKPEDIERAKEDISEEGYWGVKQTSQRLFDFASALAGDDEDKMKTMQAAMEKGFKKATGAWGRELPEICSDTIEAANNLFEDYYKSKEANAVTE